MLLLLLRLDILAFVPALRTKGAAGEYSKYTIYFYRSVVPNAHSFASPSQEFVSLEEARTFAQNAADAALIELAHSFRIESGDRTVNEHWSRQEGGWKLIGQTSDS